MANAKNTDAYLLGEINANVAALLENQKTVVKDIQDLKRSQAWLKGLAFGIGTIGGLVGGFIKSFFITTT